MSDEDDWDFAGDADAKVTIHAAVRYLLKNAVGSDRGDIVGEIIEIVRQAAQGLSVGQPDPSMMMRLADSPRGRLGTLPSAEDVPSLAELARWSSPQPAEPIMATVRQHGYSAAATLLNHLPHRR